MARTQSAIASAVAIRPADTLMRVGRYISSLWRDTKGNAARPYRRELHYMRGPGPAWCAKHGVKLSK